MSTYPGHYGAQIADEDPAVIEQRRVAATLGPCPKGGNHELRKHYSTSSTLFLAFCLGLPGFCGYAKKKVVCIKCDAEFKGVYIPEAGSISYQ